MPGGFTSNAAKSPLLYPDDTYLDPSRVAAARDEAVPDKFWLAFSIMYLLGTAALLPWNALITPIEYLNLRVAGSPFEQSFESILTTSFTCISFITLMSMQCFQDRVSLRTRIIFPLVLLIAIFAVLTGLAVVPLALPDDKLLASLRSGASTQFFALLICGMLCGIGQAVLTGSSMAYASLYARGAYIQAVSVGNGIAGVAITLGSLAVSLPGISKACAAASSSAAASLASSVGSASPLHVASTSSSAGAAFGVSLAPASRFSASSAHALSASHARDVIGAAVVYFGVSLGMLIICLLAFLFVEWLPFTQARKRLNARASADAAAAASASAATATSAPSSGGTSGGCYGADDAPSGCVQAASAPSTLAPSLAFEMSPAGPRGGEGLPGLIRQMWRQCVSIFLVYAVTIAIFPSLTSTIIAAPYVNGTAGNATALAAASLAGPPPTIGTDVLSSLLNGGRLQGAPLAVGGPGCEWRRLFVPLGFVLFNLGDVFGRGSPCILRSPAIILVLVLFRIAFAPLFMLCHTAQGGALQLPLFWGSDAMPLVFIGLFSFSNGLLTSSVSRLGSCPVPVGWPSPTSGQPCFTSSLHHRTCASVRSTLPLLNFRSCSLPLLDPSASVRSSSRWRSASPTQRCVRRAPPSSSASSTAASSSARPSPLSSVTSTALRAKPTTSTAIRSSAPFSTSPDGDPLACEAPFVLGIELEVLPATCAV